MRIYEASEYKHGKEGSISGRTEGPGWQSGGRAAGMVAVRWGGSCSLLVARSTLRRSLHVAMLATPALRGDEADIATRTATAGTEWRGVDGMIGA